MEKKVKTSIKSSSSVAKAHPSSHVFSKINGKDIYVILMFLGVVTFCITLINQRERAWASYLIGFFYFTSLALGGLFFASLHNVMQARWSVSIRRFTESLTSFLSYGFIAAIVLILVGAPHLYEWLSPHAIEKDHLIQHKVPYLNFSFLSIRWVLFFSLWIFFSHHLIKLSLAQDETMSEDLRVKFKKKGLIPKEKQSDLKKSDSHSSSPDHKVNGSSKSVLLATQLNTRMVKPSLLFIIVFVLSYTFFSFDALMSLEPHWFSTIFGVYTFSGLFQSTMAFLILLVIYKMKTNKDVNEFITVDHLHDLGKYLFTFTIFWAYIAFSQFMLIWYANLPEETFFFIPRMKNSWAYVSLSLLILKFAVPFLALLPRWAKRSPTHLAAISILVLIMQYVDIYWLVYPHYSKESVVFSLSEIFIFLGFLGVFLFSIHNFLDKNHLIPYGDPNLKISKKHHVV